MTEKEFREKERKAAMKKAAAKKRAKRRRRAMIAVTVTLSVIVLSILALIVAAVLRIEVVEIDGNTVYTAEQIIEAGDIEAGNSLVFLSKEKLALKLQKKLPFIESVSIEKELPSTLKITVTETTEELCFFDSKTYYSASKSGKILNEYSSAPEDLCVIATGEGFSFEKGENYICNDDKKSELLSALLAYSNNSSDNETIINIEDVYNCYIVIDSEKVAVLGSSSYLEGKLKFLPKMLSTLNGENYNYFDLSDWTPDNDEAYSQHKHDINNYLN